MDLSVRSVNLRTLAFMLVVVVHLVASAPPVRSRSPPSTAPPTASRPPPRASPTDRFASMAVSTTRSGRRRRRSPTSFRRSPPKAPRRPTRWKCGSPTTMTCCMSARGCIAAMAASRRRSAAATAPTRPSTSSSRSTPSSIAAPPSCSASPPPASASIAITRAIRKNPSTPGSIRCGAPRPTWPAISGRPNCGFRFRSCASTRERIRPGASTCFASGRRSMKPTTGS